ncbi:MAG: hypothetical protein Q7U61_10875, partial [Zwartia sp.]|nr:hypothetical protein [Zwartia sp.]
LRTGTVLAPPTWLEMRDLLLEHLADHYHFYGELPGVRTARKHIGWYVSGLTDGKCFSDQINRLESTHEQFEAVNQWFTAQHERSPDMAEATCDNDRARTDHLEAA